MLLVFDPRIIDDMPYGVIKSFCEVGNPFTLGRITAGESVFDRRCGAGFDLIFASRLVGQQGKACGIDFTPEMVKKTRGNLTQGGVANLDVRLSTAESIPYDDNSFDIVISKRVLNLSPLKDGSLGKIYRILRPKGRLQFADSVLKNDVSLAGSNNLEARSN